MIEMEWKARFKSCKKKIPVPEWSALKNEKIRDDFNKILAKMLKITEKISPITIGNVTGVLDGGEREGKAGFGVVIL